MQAAHLKKNSIMKATATPRRLSRQQRQVNIIERAIREFGFTPNDTDTYEEVVFKAEYVITANVDYDYMSECELHTHQHQHLNWSDGMGYDYECDGEITDYKTCDWYRWNEDTFTYDKIASWDADNEADYVECDRVIDSEGKVALLLAR